MDNEQAQGGATRMEREQRAFLAAIAAEPDDDATRLAYADWLDDRCGRGQPGWPQNEHRTSAQAELIRVQVVLLRDRGIGGEPLEVDERGRFEDRDRTLREACLAELGPELHALAKSSNCATFDRGFLNLDLYGSGIRVLPNNLTVGGSLNISATNITALPDNLTVGGGLYLCDTYITALPDNFTVGGDLNLSRTNITALPDNLTVGGSLYISATNITVLPDNLTVAGSLDLSETNISALPDDLHVKGWLHLQPGQLTAAAILAHPGLSDAAKRSGLRSAGYHPELIDQMPSSLNPADVTATPLQAHHLVIDQGRR